LPLLDPIDRSVRLFDEAPEGFRKPMIAARLLALAVHPLLNHDPLAVIGNDEAVQIKIEAVLHGGAVYLGDKPARLCQRRPIETHSLSDRDQLLGSLPGMLAAAAAYVDPEFARERCEAALQRANHTGRDARGVPVHPHHRAERLEPEGVGKTP